MNANMKIGCDKVAELIIEYIDGELDETTAELIKQHIESCPDCRKLYSDMALVCSAAAESAYEVPAELHGRVMDAVAREKTSSGRRARILGMSKTTRWLGVGIAAMLFICVGIAGSFKLLPKLINTEIGDTAPTETMPGASYGIDTQSPVAADMAQSGGNTYYDNSADSIADAEVFIYKTVKAMSVASVEETGVPEDNGELDASASEPEATKAVVTDAPCEEAPSEPEVPEAIAPPTANGVITPAPSSEPLSQIIAGTWVIESDAGTVRLILSGGYEPRYILYTSAGTVTGSYSLNDHFLSLNVLGKDSACYIVGVKDGIMTLLQISPNGLF